MANVWFDTRDEHADRLATLDAQAPQVGIGANSVAVHVASTYAQSSGRALDAASIQALAQLVEKHGIVRSNFESRQRFWLLRMVVGAEIALGIDVACKKRKERVIISKHPFGHSVRFWKQELKAEIKPHFHAD